MASYLAPATVGSLSLLGAISPEASLAMPVSYSCCPLTQYRVRPVVEVAPLWGLSSLLGSLGATYLKATENRSVNFQPFAV